MAARALAAVAGRRAAGQSGFPALASCRRGGAQGHSSSSAHTQAEERNADHDAAADTVTAEQVETALNSKNVEEMVQEGRAATVLPEEVVDDADAAWVPDQETGVFAPGAVTDGPHEQPGRPLPSVLDQAVFVREEDIEDVERPSEGNV
ncbi:uncharacterized protein LOC133896255 [Phragmites australis]|uniref:uncharacterized protein LOC133896255 n=1 Tax=Phragmites australis TaxID=29695 RepID=UPI002D784285|nr:uncharacterized protein LOC133896255 [Phragmites australis]